MKCMNRFVCLVNLGTLLLVARRYGVCVCVCISTCATVSAYEFFLCKAISLKNVPTRKKKGVNLDSNRGSREGP